MSDQFFEYLMQGALLVIALGATFWSLRILIEHSGERGDPKPVLWLARISPFLFWFGFVMFGVGLVGSFL